MTTAAGRAPLSVRREEVVGEPAPELSVCIVNWNGRELLRNLLRSLRAATAGLPAETIVVDNASTDGSPEMVEREFPEVALVRNDRNLGFARANNQAAERARGRLLLFLNNDTVIPPSSVDDLVRFMDAHPELSAVAPRLVGDDGRPQPSCRNAPTFGALLGRIWFLRVFGFFRGAHRRFRRPALNENRSGAVGIAAGAALLTRRDRFVECGRWDEAFEFGLEDADLCARLACSGPVYYLADVEIIHLGRVSSRANCGFVYRTYECGYARYLRKQSRGRWRVWLYKLLVTADMPVRVAALAVRWAAHAITGRRERAARIGRNLAAASEFLVFGLPRFWIA